MYIVKFQYLKLLLLNMLQLKYIPETVLTITDTDPSTSSSVLAKYPSYILP